MTETKHDYNKLLIAVLLIVISILLLFRTCDTEKSSATETLELEAQQNINNSKFYFDQYLLQTKKTASFEKKADSLQDELNNSHLPKWTNRKKIVSVKPIADI